MKKSFIILGVLAALIVLVLGTTVSAGEHHVVVVEENVHLIEDNHKLKSSNDSLVKENKVLSDKANILEHQIKAIKDSIVIEPPIDHFKVALVSLEKVVEEDLTWISPESAYFTLSENLSRKPTKEEYTQTLDDLISKNLLYHYIAPDPYMKGKKVTKKEVNKLVEGFVK